MKKLLGVYAGPPRHWVGDGFPVRSLFSYNENTELHSPFLLFDHAGPQHFDPADKPRGVGEHPHRGFETVTIVFEGEVSHRDSTGSGGTIGPGDVQWMTAGAGILHEEFHSPAFTAAGGNLHMVQLWVNLPAADKATTPTYQAILDKDIPSVQLADGAGSVRVIAGEYEGHRGPAHTFTPMNVWDVNLAAGAEVSMQVTDGHTLTLAILDGETEINGKRAAAGQLAVFEREGSEFTIRASSASKVMLLSGEPIDEPVVGYGPFVMNTREEIRTAISEFNGGRFGRIPPELR